MYHYAIDMKYLIILSDVTQIEVDDFKSIDNIYRVFELKKVNGIEGYFEIFEYGE